MVGLIMVYVIAAVFMLVELVFSLREDRPFAWKRHPVLTIVFCAIACGLWFIYLPIMGYLHYAGELKDND